jgi:hypothetical protein
MRQMPHSGITAAEVMLGEACRVWEYGRDVLTINITAGA